MKLRILDRILAAVVGIILLCGCAALVMQLIFGLPVAEKMMELLQSESWKARTLWIVIAVLLLLLGVYCVLVLFRHRRGRDKIVEQKTEYGEVSISLRALEELTRKCLDEFPDLDVQALHLEIGHGHVTVRIRAYVAGGISIPLLVNTVQEEIRNYLMNCTGVEVNEIKVLIDSTGDDAINAPYALKPGRRTELLQEEDKKETQDAESAEALKKTGRKQKPDHRKPLDVPSDDDRPLHQRLFSQESAQCTVPVPPDMAETIQQKKTEDSGNEIPSEVETLPENMESRDTDEAEKTGAVLSQTVCGAENTDDEIAFQSIAEEWQPETDLPENLSAADDFLNAQQHFESSFSKSDEEETEVNNKSNEE